MERVLIILLMFMTGTAFSAGLYKHVEPEQRPHYSKSRATFVTHLAEQFGQADTLVVGDSLVEQANLDGACGRTFNGGIGGARIQDLQTFLPVLIAATDPERVVIAIGTNHFAAGDEIEDFRQLFPLLVAGVSGRDLVLVGVPNSAEANQIVSNVAAAAGAAYVPPVTGPLQADGVHHTVEGSRLYREAISKGCKAALQA